MVMFTAGQNLANLNEGKINLIVKYVNLAGESYSLNTVEWKSTLLGVILGITSFWIGNPL